MISQVTASSGRPTAVVVAVQLPDVGDGELTSSIAELERLARTLGLVPVGRLTQRRARLAPGIVLGEGKLAELAEWTGGTGVVPAYEKPGRRTPARDAARDEEDGEEADEADDEEQDDDARQDAAGDAARDVPDGTDADEPRDEVSAAGRAGAAAHAPRERDDDRAARDRNADRRAAGGPGGAAVSDARATEGTAGSTPEPRAQVVLVDHDLTPTQQRNLERATGADVLDRTSVILEIFHRHARTREARLQVEIARLRYLAPRLREGSGGGDRVRGGIGGKGAGESALELDRRRIRDRIAELRHELTQIEGGSRTRRDRRSDLPTVALVGYTNAGKSSLMRALTSTDVYVADKLFATLDTTVRRLQPPTEPPILVSDTVGFIKKLPHDLVASFRSTLDEAGDADLLLHVVDAADPAHADHIAVTREVLRDIAADTVPTLIVLNKIDRVDAAGRAALADRYPTALQLSAKDPADVAALHDRLIEQFAGKLEDAELDVPWTAQRVVHAIHERATVLAEHHHDAGTRLTIRAPSRVVAELRAALSAAS
ncbi:MAG TPA: GTPase HflX [Kofleriaceae bacterium]|jgi:GTP-binding protein HflX|nr:GTPase HflX [Kofleriaceae bacterium]